MVKQAIAVLPQNLHPAAQLYLAIAPDLEFDAGLVDTFLHGRDRAYSVEDCLERGSPVPDWSSRTGCSTRPTTRPPW